MASIFTKIINREVPANIVAESDEFISFLDINPLIEGHCLVVPKVEIDYIYNLDDDLLARLNVFAKKVAKGIEKSVACERIGVTVIGLEVPHAHIHLIPINSMNDMNFSRMKLKPERDELVAIACKISENISL